MDTDDSSPDEWIIPAVIGARDTDDALMREILFIKGDAIKVQYHHLLRCDDPDMDIPQKNHPQYPQIHHDRPELDKQRTHQRSYPKAIIRVEKLNRYHSKKYPRQNPLKQDKWMCTDNMTDLTISHIPSKQARINRREHHMLTV